ncbi:MAG: hypothetical protein AAF840_11330 [Bacteroidota bacterium]
MYRLLLAFSFLLLFACSPQLKLQNQLSGKWDMVGIQIYNEDASPQLNPMHNRWISFDPSGSFASGSGDQQENAGSYVLNQPEARLDLDSDAGPGDDSSWRLTFRNDSLLMRGIGTDRQENSELILVRQLK